jgi:hypothetical protein
MEHAIRKEIVFIGRYGQAISGKRGLGGVKVEQRQEV